MPGSILSALCGVTFLLQQPSEVGSSFMWEDTETFPPGSRRESEAELDSNSGINPLALCCLLESFSPEEDRACRTEDFENCSSEMEQTWRESVERLAFTSICHNDMPIVVPSSPWVR